MAWTAYSLHPRHQDRPWMRWTIALAIAAALCLTVLLFSTVLDKHIPVATPPLLELAFVELPAAPKPHPPQPPKPPRVQPPEQTPQPPTETVTVPQAAVEPSAPSAEPADIAPAPAAQTTERFSISSSNELDNTSFEPLFNPRPLYPLMAQRASIQGFVDVELFVDEGGRVERFSITTVSGHPGFGNETAKVIGKWRFPPPRIGGKAVKVRYPYRVYFKLQ